MQEFEFFTPRSPDELFSVLENTGGMIVAGGTDILPRLRKYKISPSCLINNDRIEALRYFSETYQGIQIGSLTTHQEIAESKILTGAVDILRKSAASVGSPQTRNRGTLGGNLANASPAADTLPALFALDAGVILLSKNGQRIVPVDHFYLAPGKTALQKVEIIQGVIFQKPAGRWGSSFLKLGKRNGMSIAVVSVAATLHLDDDDRITRARIALGSAAPTVVRGKAIEDVLLNQTFSPELFQQASLITKECIEPIDDIRATAAYRIRAATILVRRALEEAYFMAFKRGEG